jgi:hypothetical protein
MSDFRILQYSNRYREMAERLKAAVLKTVVALRLPGVRIPLSLQTNKKAFKTKF